MNLVFTLCSNNYLAQAKSLGESYLSHNPGASFIIGLADRYDPSIDYKTFGEIRVLGCEELKYPEFTGMMARYNITEFNTAVKPFFFEYFLQNGHDKVIFLDPDIIVYDSFDPLFRLLDEFEVLFTPHNINPYHEFENRWQRVINQVGIYNLGFLAMRKSENTMQILEWWKKKLEKDCYMIPASGLFVDQIWANFFPVFFNEAKFHLLKDPGYNVAYWNFGERKLEKKDNGYSVNDSKLKFFHFSNYKMNEPERISIYSDYTFAQRPDLVGIYDEYRNLLLANGFETYSKLSPGLPLRSDRNGFFKITGLRIKVHGTRLFHRTIKFVFGV